MNDLLLEQLYPCRRRLRWRSALAAMVWIWSVVALALLAIRFWAPATTHELPWTATFIGIALIGSLLAVVRARSQAVSGWPAVARAIEAKYPDLDIKLLTALEPLSQPHGARGFLQRELLRQTYAHSLQHRWSQAISGWGIAGRVVFLFGALIIACWLGLIEPWRTWRFERQAAPVIPVVNPLANWEVQIEPGNAEVERGDRLLVLARFGRELPAEVVLHLREESGAESQLAMPKSLDDPIFGARIAAVAQPLVYWVEYAGKRSEEFRVQVFDLPRLVRCDALLKFPSYTKLPEKNLADTRRIAAVEGTQVSLELHLNVPVAMAELKPITAAAAKPSKEMGQADSLTAADEVPQIVLYPDPSRPTVWQASFPITATQRYQLLLRDAQGRTNKDIPTLAIQKIENRETVIQWIAPGRDTEASPLQEIELVAELKDDFGVEQAGVSISVPGKAEIELPLAQGLPANQPHRLNYLLALEDLQVEPDQLVSFYFWADDIAGDGTVRRQWSDMYFAEIRPFEQIFRQGQPPPGGGQQGGQQGQAGAGGQNGQQAQELAELQKQIINSLWNVLRRETGPERSANFIPDVTTIRESQATALGQIEELTQALADEQSQAFGADAKDSAQRVIDELTQAVAQQQSSHLKPALAQAQATYQALLRLRAREFEVVQQQQRQQQSQQGQQSNSRNQQMQQLQQLDLQPDENPYQQQQLADSADANPQEREDRQVLNRLRELARRQSDLNERIKELESALNAEKQPENQAELERQLKTLREQQEEMLRDAEELLERMEQGENQERMNDQAQQLQQTRDQLQQATEALDRQQLSRAAAAGARAANDLEELRDEFQNRTAGQFDEQVRELQSAARSLEQQQQELQQSLQNPAAAAQENRTDTPPSLLDEKPADDVAQRLQQQQQQVEQLRERLQQTVQEAEPFEPLLANQLYDAWRNSEVTRPDRALQEAQDSWRRGWQQDAANEQARAGEGIRQLREDIEQAAESVLGDEAQSLQMARDTLNELSQQLQDELNRLDPNGNPTEKPNRTNNDRASNQDAANGNPTDPGNNDPTRTPESGGNAGQAAQRQPESQPQSPPGRTADGQGDPQQNDANQPGPGASGRNAQQPPAEQAQNQQNQGEQNAGGQNQDARTNSENRGGNGGGQTAPADREGSRDNQAQANDARDPFNPENQPRDGERPEGDPRGGEWNQTPRYGENNLRMMNPISGDDFRQWSDRLRDVEEMLSDPELRGEAARIREQARELRRDWQRHSADPNWELVRQRVAAPLSQLQREVTEEWLRKTTKDAVVPVDRQPVPRQYQDAVRRYYERIGSGQ